MKTLKERLLALDSFVGKTKQVGKRVVAYIEEIPEICSFGDTAGEAMTNLREIAVALDPTVSNDYTKVDTIYH